MKPLLCLLVLCLPLALATKHTDTVTIGGRKYQEILYAQGPLTLSYIVEVLGGAPSGSVDVFWVNDENYRHLVNREAFQYSTSFSQSDTAYASLSATDCTCDDSFYHLVVRNRNELLSIRVWYTVEVTFPPNASGGASIIPGLLVLGGMVLIMYVTNPAAFCFSWPVKLMIPGCVQCGWGCCVGAFPSLLYPSVVPTGTGGSEQRSSRCAEGEFPWL
jgi:hypothetical protein